MIELFRNFDRNLDPLTIAIGNFDGIHLGHQELIKEVVKYSNINSSIPTILTFNPHPKEYFTGKKDFQLFSFRSKIRLLESHGIKRCIILKFNSDLISTSAIDFFYNFIFKKMNIRHITIGYDFKFGKDRAGDTLLLEKLAKLNNIGFTKIKEINVQNYPCSSSIIREALSNGNVELVNKLLGRNYHISGKVVEGRKLARELGFPTANIKLGNILKPKYGVYIVKVNIENNNINHYAIANIGLKPTIGKNNELLEIHILNFSLNIYGKKIKVEFMKFLRDERKFLNLSELGNQINIDVNMCKNFYELYKV